VDRRHISPKAEQGPAAISEPRRQKLPEILVHDDTRTRPMPLDPPPIRDQLGQCRHKWVFLFPLNSDPSALIASIVFPWNQQEQPDAADDGKSRTVIEYGRMADPIPQQSGNDARYQLQ